MSVEPNNKTPDHRVRVAARRREQMQARLMAAALLVFGRRGVEASVIDEITSVAGVSRGTFYNYFRTNEELFAAVAVAASDEMIRAVEPFALAHADPAARIGTASRMWLTLLREHAHLAAFFRRSGFFVLEQSAALRENLPRDLMDGIRSGRFAINSLELGFALVTGTVLATTNSFPDGKLPAGLPEDIAERVLISLGIEADEARSIARAPLDLADLPEDSLIIRSGKMLRELGSQDPGHKLLGAMTR